MHVEAVAVEHHSMDHHCDWQNASGEWSWGTGRSITSSQNPHLPENDLAFLELDRLKRLRHHLLVVLHAGDVGLAPGLGC